MDSPLSKNHASDSSEQQNAEAEIRRKLENELGVSLEEKPDVGHGLSLDGFSGGDNPVCVEKDLHSLQIIGDFTIARSAADKAIHSRVTQEFATASVCNSP